jgi:hypothetical protein
MTDEEIAVAESLANALLRAQGWTDDDFERVEDAKNWSKLTEAEKRAHFDRFVLPRPTDAEGETPSG